LPAAGSSLRSSEPRIVDPASDDVVDAIRGLTDGGAMHALDTTAIGAVINHAIDALAPLGTLALVGVGIPEIRINVQGLIGGGKTVRGVIEGDAVPQKFIPQLLELHAEARLPLEKLIRTYDFDDINVAVADTASGSTIKPVLVA
jgi:aryl-alcohol dehydrogenase